MHADLKKAGILVNLSSRRPALFLSLSHDHPADCCNVVDKTASLAVAHFVALRRNMREAAAGAADFLILFFMQSVL